MRQIPKISPTMSSNCTRTCIMTLPVLLLPDPWQRLIFGNRFYFGQVGTRSNLRSGSKRLSTFNFYSTSTVATYSSFTIAVLYCTVCCHLQRQRQRQRQSQNTIIPAGTFLLRFEKRECKKVPGTKFITLTLTLPLPLLSTTYRKRVTGIDQVET